MPKPLSIFAAILTLAAAAGHAAEPQANFFVAPGGNDAWSGKLAAPNAQKNDGPVATLERAINLARNEKRGEAPATILVRGGMYSLAATLQLAPEDSNLVIAAYPGEKPVFSGGTAITNFKKDGKGWWVAELLEVKEGKWNFTQVWVDGVRRYRPRFPKDAYWHVAEQMEPSEFSKGKGFDRFKFKAGEIKANWHNLEDVEVIAFQVWTMARMRIRSVDEKESVVTFTGDTRSKAGYSAMSKGRRYFVENVREALSEPGEWYLDRKAGTLTYIPMPGEAIGKTQVIAPRIEQLVNIAGDLKTGKYVQKLTLRGLTFAHGNWTTPPQGNNYPQAEVNLPGAIALNGTRDVTIEDCEVRQVGIYGIDIAADNKRARIERCVLADLGAGGVKIGLTRYEKEPAIATSHNIVRNNLIFGGGRLHPAAVGVWIGHSGVNSIDRNTISDFYYTGISVGWSWGYNPAGALNNKIAYNDVHTLGQWVLSDMGGIYTLGLSDGTVIHHNRFANIYAYDYGGWGIYFDEGTTHITAENNVVHHVKTGGFHQHYGKENIVRNNIFAFSKNDQLQRTRKEPHQSFTFEGNIVYWKADQGPLLGSNWDDTDKYVLNRNLYWRGGAAIDFARVKVNGKDKRLSFEEWQAKGQDKDSIIADPLFKDPEKGDFTLDKTSPAGKIGFVPIDLAGLGCDAEVKARWTAKVPPAFPVGEEKR